ncbi:MAG: hypothetical protein ACOY45_14605 [Pseudomonadota bacterium]
MARALAHFAVSRTGDDYTLLIEDEDGETIEFVATIDQLDLILDAVTEQIEAEDDLLDVDDEAEDAVEE